MSSVSSTSTSGAGLYEGAVAIAKDYYDSDDADRFYLQIWGGEDIHVGIYRSDDEAIADASRRTVHRLVSKLESPEAGLRAIDLGAGFGGAARFLARSFGWEVTALNLSTVQNDRNRSLCREHGLDHLVTVVDGSFESIPSPDGRYDVIWSQDAILHAADRPKVISEMARVLKAGGQAVFTDPMQADDCPEGVLQPILDRIHLEDLASPSFYRSEAARVGLEVVEFEDLTPNLTRHYARVLEETERQEERLARAIDPGYIERMKTGLQHWIDGGEAGHLSWGIFHLRKPA